MSFETLGTEIQNILLNNHSYISKWFVFLVTILLSAFYIFYVWNDHKPTKYFLVAVSRLFTFALAVVFLATSPYQLLLMSPEYSFLDFYNLHLILYSILFSLGAILIFVDIIRYGFFVLLRLAGLDFGDSNVRDIANQIKNNKHFIKLGRK